MEIDDQTSENHLCRFLLHVDFRKLEPGKPSKFLETLLAPGFSPGAYLTSIWIPSADLSWKFDASQNLLLSPNGVPDPATGLNQITKFTIAASARR
jgi:hypothetical protein